MRRPILPFLGAVLALLVTACAPAWTATVQGYVLDPNWYAPHPQLTSPQVYGTGQYEYGVGGNIAYSTLLGFSDDTDVYGNFYKSAQPDGVYTLASWDTWWRSTYVFDTNLVGIFTLRQYLRLRATAWSYMANWDPGWHNEYGQLFEATGSSMVMVTVNSASPANWTVSVHDGGPTGPQVGQSRDVSGGGGPSGMRIVWNGGDVPTVPGQVYYLKLKAKDGATAALCVNDPIPDMSDMSPAGPLYLDGSPADPAKDFGVTINSDDDGLLTNMFIRGGSSLAGSRIGQTFRARGTSLVSFVAWLPGTSFTYTATLYNAVGGTQIGTAKKATVMRGADPEVLWTWSPGECPLTPGNTYYIEVTIDGSTQFSAYANPWEQYWQGGAYVNRIAQPVTTDMAGTIMEEESPGSATKPTVQFATFPAVASADRAPTSLTVRWTTDVAADSTVQYAAWNCPYTDTYYNSSLVTTHAATLTGLQPNTMYHIRVKSAASGYRTGVTRDFVMCTTNDTANLLANPGFEEGSGSSPRTIPSWTCSGMDIKASDGTWFYGLPPYSGSWLCEAAINGGDCNGVVYQRVPATPGVEYRFTTAITSWMRENNNWKYDVWTSQGRLDYLRIGIDPTGGTDPNSSSVQWTQRFYSHLRYTVLGTKATATGNNVTVFFSLVGRGGQWHLYGIDDCRLTAHANYTAFGLADLKKSQADGTSAEVADLIVTATSSEAGAYYAETAERTCGIRIVSGDTATVGQRVTVRGLLQTDSVTGERYLSGATFPSKTGAIEPRPLDMLCRNIGGAAYGSIPAVPDSSGPHNTGLAIKVAGSVTIKGANYVFLNDGSLPGYGLKVDMSHVSSALIPNAGQVVGLSGISSLYNAGGVKPLLIVRRASDVSPVYGP